MSPGDDRWASGEAYEAYMGRWSRVAARVFLQWLSLPPGAHWLDVGCGTGALTSGICDHARPASVVACDPSASFVDDARRRVPDARATFVVAGSDDLPHRAGGGGMDLLHHVWSAAIAMDAAAAALDESRRFPLCEPEPLASLFRDAGLVRVETRALDPRRREALRRRLRQRLQPEAGGPIRLRARAWAVRGHRA